MYKKIIVPIDGSRTSSLALDEAIHLGKHLNSTIDIIHIVHTIEDDAIPSHREMTASENAYEKWTQQGKSVLEYAKAQLEKSHLHGELLLVEHLNNRKDIAEAIINAARQQHAELIIIGSHGISGFREHTLGRVAQQLLDQGEFPVWLIRGEKASEPTKQDSELQHS